MSERDPAPSTHGTEPPAGAGRAIVTFARSWQALTVIRSLGRRGVEVIAGDEYDLTPGGLSRYCAARFSYPDPARDRQGFLAALERAIEEHCPDDGQPLVLVPVHRETFVIAEERARFEPRAAMALPDPERIAAVRDKGRLVELARDAGVPVPDTWQPGSADELRAAADEIPLPAIVKVRRGVAGVGLEKVETRADLLATFEKMVEQFRLEPSDLPIVQALAPGDDYCVTALFDRGAPRATMTYRNLAKLSDGAPGAIRETVEARAAEAATRKLLADLDWHGIAEVDFMWDGRDDSEPVLIEINPRLFGGLFQAVASGVDYPWMLYRLALGDPVPEPEEVKIGARTEAPVLGLLATMRELAEEAGDFDGVAEAWRAARGELESKGAFEGLRRLWRGLADELDPEARIERVRSVLERNEGNVSMLLESGDARAGLGLIYPLAVFLRHGKVTSDLLAGASLEGDGFESD